MLNTNLFAISRSFFPSKLMSLNNIKDLDKQQIQRLEDYVDKNERRDYTSESIVKDNKKPEPIGTGLSDRLRCGNPSLSPPLIYEKEKVMEDGFIMLQRSARELFEKDLDAFLLLTQIAFRARRTASPFDRNLTINQAKIGDYESCGLTRQRYRDALERLVVIYRLITIKATNKGTIATLLTSTVYDINPDNQEPTEKPTRNQQGTTKEECNNNNSSSSEVLKPKKSKKDSTPKKPKESKPPKQPPTPEELQVREKRIQLLELANECGFPLHPRVINAQIKKYSLKAVRHVVKEYIDGFYDKTDAKYLEASIFNSIKQQHELIEDLNDARSPNAA